MCVCVCVYLVDRFGMIENRVESRMIELITGGVFRNSNKLLIVHEVKRLEQDCNKLITINMSKIF